MISPDLTLNIPASLKLGGNSIGKKSSHLLHFSGEKPDGRDGERGEADAPAEPGDDPAVVHRGAGREPAIPLGPGTLSSAVVIFQGIDVRFHSSAMTLYGT